MHWLRWTAYLVRLDVALHLHGHRLGLELGVLQIPHHHALEEQGGRAFRIGALELESYRLAHHESRRAGLWRRVALDWEAHLRNADRADLFCLVSKYSSTQDAPLRTERLFTRLKEGAGA